VRRFGSEEEIRIEVDRRLHRPRSVDADGNTSVRSGLEIGVHAQRDGHVLVRRERDAPHRHRLQRLFGHLSQYVRRVQTDFGALRRRHCRVGRRAIVAENVVNRGLQVGVAESLDDHPVHATQLPTHGRLTVHAHDRADADRGIDRGPEMKLVRGVGSLLGRDDSAHHRGHWIARRYSSQSRMP
jgi:hypothetical protein